MSDSSRAILQDSLYMFFSLTPHRIATDIEDEKRPVSNRPSRLLLPFRLID